MIHIDLLKNHPESIPVLSQIWYEVLGKIWIPGIEFEQIIKRFKEHLNEDILPLTLVAFVGDKPVGMCSLRENDGIRPDLKPWLGSLVIDLAYHKRGIGKILINEIKKKAKSFNYEKLYLFTFDATLPEYYSRLGWNKIGIDELKNHPVTVTEILL